jgi:ADP-dependent NAD(P)H-hydrate dehydratase / NAD(P)H-hydrate epimerase
MLAIVGTVPDQDVPVLVGEATMEFQQIAVGGRRFPINRGTPALLGAAIQVCQVLGESLPVAFLVGDIGLGDGSRRLYRFLTEEISCKNFDVIAFHYLQPDVDWHNRVIFAIEEMTKRPVLIADAGFMYAAKMSGEADSYDLFTPDIGELAFLADEEAPHPFYTRGFIIHKEHEVEELMARAYQFRNASKYLLVKGSKDYIACEDGILKIVDHPGTEAMEAIGGTGDTLTGIVAALVNHGMKVGKASEKAAKINRTAGVYAMPTPATQIAEIIKQIPRAIKEIIRS